ncbi:MAG: sugar ABC transporter permease [Ruminococcaceae bacterium]|nr:sugar ABC transporter permease [Oscillospiraceae bacterium]
MAITNSKQDVHPNAKANKGTRLPNRNKKGGTSFWARVWAQRELLLMVLPGVLFWIIFRYGPIWGLKVAFQKYSPFLGDASPWVGFQHFKRFFGQKDFWDLVENTVMLGVLSFVVTFPCTIIFSLILNEVRQPKMKKAYQTISYLPTFFSIVIICSLFRQMLSPTTGVVNVILGWFGVKPIDFMLKSEYYYMIYIGSGLWAGLGSGAIIYLSALAGVDTQLYEAAEIDGCSRFKRIIHITLPSILPTIVIMFLLAIGGIVSVGVDKSLLLMEPSTYDVSDVISTYIYRVGVVQGTNMSYSAAIGFVQSVISCILVVTFNKISSVVTETSLW